MVARGHDGGVGKGDGDGKGGGGDGGDVLVARGGRGQDGGDDGSGGGWFLNQLAVSEARQL